MHAFDETFDYVKFVDEGFAAQSKYAKKAGDKWDALKNYSELIRSALSAAMRHRSFFNEALQARYQKNYRNIWGHLVEEMVEARVYVPRRSWKNNEPSYLDNDELRSEFVAEVFDILLFSSCDLWPMLASLVLSLLESSPR